MMIKCLIYCTKSKDYHLDCEIVNGKKKWFCWDKKSHHYPFKYVKEELGDDYKETFNGHIVAQFDCEKVEEFTTDYRRNDKPVYIRNGNANYHRGFGNTCLSYEQLNLYLENKKAYAIHINNLEIFDRPYDLYEWFNKDEKPLTKAPQNMCYCYHWLGDEYVLISIRPEWVAKILNGEKTIEIRKSIVNKLKELI